ncbi:MAG: hypothetical protein Q4F06_06430 [Eubacteriales bacterium]|nr:hypothetical protein [Eubacteriales bacterium]
MENNNVTNEREIPLTMSMCLKIDKHMRKTMAAFAFVLLILFLIPTAIEYFLGNLIQGIKAGLAIVVFFLFAFFNKIRIRGKYKLYEVVCEGKTKDIVNTPILGDSHDHYIGKQEEYKIAYHLNGVPKFTEIDEKMYENTEVGDKFYVVVYPDSQFKYVLEHDFFDR